MHKVLIDLKDNSEKILTYKLVSQRPIGKRVEVSDGVFSERLKDNDEGTMFFKVSMEKGSLVHNSKHDCIEDMVLFSGKLLELISNTTVDSNKILRIQPNQSHSIYAIEDSVFYAQLYKPKRK